ncbi:phosphomevalonate kinase-like isoform X2 [Corticium candelabrum]|nr:phosphomevalonate kinase-like isoform X2 [Corticium candelabrum]
MRLSAPLKTQYAKDHGLDVERLLDASEYKEKYRKDMIQWGEEMRRIDSGYFCLLAIQQVSDYDRYPVWLISDGRRPSDLIYFQTRYPTVTIRICASEATRMSRGWVYTVGVDDVESECALDGIAQWDFIVHNDADKEQLESHFEPLLCKIRGHIANGIRWEKEII